MEVHVAEGTVEVTAGGSQRVRANEALRLERGHAERAPWRAEMFFEPRRFEALEATRSLREHPACVVHGVEEFDEPNNCTQLLPAPVDAENDDCDQQRAKPAIASWSLAARVPLVCTGEAAGKQRKRRGRARKRQSHPLEDDAAQ